MHPCIQNVARGIPFATFLILLAEYGRYSSVVERALCKRTVVGSNPTGGLLLFFLSASGVPVV